MPDYICPDCGGLITCLSCVELHAAYLPHGPAFVNQFHDPDSYRNDYLKQPMSNPDEERETQDCADEEFETIAANEFLSFDPSHFTDTLKPDSQHGPVAQAPPSQQSLFG